MSFLPSSRRRFAASKDGTMRCFPTSALTLATLVGPMMVPAAAQTQQTRQVSVVHDMAPVGLGLGQTLRYTWANLADAETQNHFKPLRLVVRLLAEDATVIAQDAAEAVGPGQFQMFDFSRGVTNRAGDAATARLQVRIQAIIVAHSTFAGIMPQRILPFDDGVEIIDEASGATTVAKGGGFNELTMDDTAGKENAPSYGRSNGFQIVSAGKDSSLVGVVPGESLIVTVVGPTPTAEADRQFKPLFAFTVLSAGGDALVESDAVTLEPGRLYSFEIPSSSIGALTGRVQVRIETRYFHGVISRLSAGADELATALEVVDVATGRTVVHLSQKPKEIVVVGSKIPR